MDRLLLVLHALFAFALAGAATHLFLVTVGFLRGSKAKVRLGRIYAVTTAILLLTTVGLGAWLYPAFKVKVVVPYFDREAPWAAALFDMKEALALLGVPLAVGLLLLGQRPDPTDRPVLWVFALCALGTFALVAFCVVAGLLVVAERAV